MDINRRFVRASAEDSLVFGILKRLQRPTSVNPNALNITNNEAKHRFETQIGSQVAVLEYTRATGLIVYNHTEVPRELKGQGIASQLAKTALEFARSNELDVMPLCPYVAAYIRRHPEYRDVLRRGFNV